jgi:hypothetical protein
MVAVTAALVGAAAVATPVAAQTFPNRPPDATFYETTENMRVIGKGKPRRVAHSALLGFAAVDTPFCPGAEARAAVASATQCTLNALGEDDINLVTATGSFDAKLTIVVQEPGSVDSPETVVAKRRASGRMDFTPAILNGIPYGTITGRVRRVGEDEDNPPRFVGLFRLPFACGTGHCFLGLADGTLGAPVPVESNEYAIGFPAVRFDLWFIN